jgi:transcriptional regulator with XRE-family HTH domain
MIAKNIKDIRKEQKLTQLDLAKRVGVSSVAIAKIESGMIKNPRHLNKIALALGTTEECLRFGKNSNKAKIPLVLSYLILPITMPVH